MGLQLVGVAVGVQIAGGDEGGYRLRNSSVCACGCMNVRTPQWTVGERAVSSEPQATIRPMGMFSRSFSTIRCHLAS